MSLWDEAKKAIPPAMKAVFGEGEDRKITFAQAGQTTVQVEAIFIERFEMVELNGEIPIQSTGPVFDIQLDDLGFKPKQGAVITRYNGLSYEVTQTEPDGEGGVKLFVVKRK